MGGGCQGTGTDDGLLDLSASRGTLFYWGHSTFSLTSASGKVLVFNPYDPALTGLPRYQSAADVVLLSDSDADQSDTTWLIGNPTIVHGLGSSGDVAEIDQDYGPFHVQTVPALHGGAAGGATAIFIVEVDGVRVVHLGSLGQASLDDNQVEAIGHADFLMVPVGGGSTIGGTAACDVAEKQLGPGYALPMHYRLGVTPAPLASQLDTAGEFIDCWPSDPAPNNGRNGITLNYADVPTEPTLLVLEYLP